MGYNLKGRKIMFGLKISGDVTNTLTNEDKENIANSVARYILEHWDEVVAIEVDDNHNTIISIDV